MSIRIIVDSGCDISQQEAQTLGITVLPLTIMFNGKQYRDGIDLSYEQFYQMMAESETLPKTSQVTPFQFEEAFTQYPDDEILCITMSSGISGTYQSACIAAEETDHVFVIDSRGVSLAERNLVYYALELIRQNKSALEIREILTDASYKLIVIALLDNLNNLAKGGRISNALAAAGNFLSVKAAITTNSDGQIVLAGKARGSKKGYQLLDTLCKDRGEINYDLPVCAAYAGNGLPLLDRYLDDNLEHYQITREQLPIVRIGAAVGTHSGDGAIAVSFFIK